MDQTEQQEQQEIENNASGTSSEPQGTDTANAQDLQPESAPAEQEPVKAPRKRRTASAPAGAPPSAPVEVIVSGQSPSAITDAAVLEPESAAPARKRATRSRKPTTGQSADQIAEVPTGVDLPSASGMDPVVQATPPARATRARRRAATAEAGPAAPVEDAVSASAPAAPAPAAAVAPSSDDAPTAESSRSVPDAVATSAAPRAPRKRRRAATADAGPAVAVGTDPAGVAAIGNASVVAASDSDPTGSTAGDPAGADAAPKETVTRTRRTAGSGRSRRVSASVQAGDREEESVPDAVAAPADQSAPAVPSDEAADEAATSSTDQGVTDENATDDKSADETSVNGNRFDPFAFPESPLSLLFHAPDLTTVTVPSVKVASPVEDADEEESEESGRRSRRSRRGRSRSRNEPGQTDSSGSDSGQADSGGVDGEDSADRQRSGGPDEGPGVSSRRRRRRRRGDQDLELTGGEDDDPPNTVTRVRAPRQSAEPVSDRVTSVRGSTRLEAKKQRRRESRDTGRRRQVITEAEFLARRESVDRQMIVRQRDDRIQIGVLEDGILGEHFVSRTQQDSLIGNVYVGKVQNVLPSMEAAFVDIGRGRNAVLYAGEVNWDAAGLDGQPRRIELALKSGDPVLVQVTKDPVGHKGARLTSQISLPGRYLVYVPGGSMTGISRKLPDVERNRLKRILKDRLPENAGVIVRTAAEGASEEELTHDINRLRAQWEEIERKAGSTKTLAPELLYGEPDLTIKVVRDVFNEDFSKLVVSGEEAWDTIEAYVMYVAPDLVGRLEKWTSDEDIFSASRIDEQIAKALERKVFLPSGGSLVIDRTEAMTVVDVNTGKFTGSGGNLEETVTKNNLEAAEEVVRQLRLRDIGGIIVIDFIDMVLEANRDLVLRRLVECLGRDRTKHQVAEVTSLGLVQMTRKRMGTGLLEVFGEDCEHCAGRGVVTYMEPVEHHHTPGPETQQQPRQDRPSRSERKRSRGRGGLQDEGFVAAPPPVVESPDRAAKAEAARAALASIAAATHQAHEEPAEQVAESVDIQVTEAVLTINGETVTLPRSESRRVEPAVVEATPDTRLTLDSLSEAFNRRSPESVGAPVTGEAAGAGTTAQPEKSDEPDVVESSATASTSTRAQSENRRAAPSAASTPVRRPRRRVASSAQGAADTRIETHSGEGADQASGNRHVTTSQPVAVRTEAGDEPVIFGVGVPASQL